MQVILQRGKGRRVEDGHPWVYGNEIDTIVGEPKTGDIIQYENVIDYLKVFTKEKVYTIHETLVSVEKNLNPDHFIFAKGYHYSKKKIKEYSYTIPKLLERKTYREKLNYTENYRLCFGEGDFLPALVIDKFNDNYVIQTLSAGMDKWKSVIVEILLSDFNAKGIYERNDVPVRKLEGLEEIKGFYKNNPNN